jgi:signal transduction histidine kinase
MNSQPESQQVMVPKSADSALAAVARSAQNVPEPVLDLLIALARHVGSLKTALALLEGRIELRDRLALTEAQTLRNALEDLRNSLNALKEIDFGMKRKDHLLFESAVDVEINKITSAIESVNIWYGIQTDPSFVFEREVLEKISVAQLVAIALDDLDPRLDKSRLKIEIPAGLTITTAPNRLKLCINELVDNALRYSTEVVELLAGLNEDGELWIEVADYGPGLNGRDPEELFKPIGKRQAATFGRADGFGMGLYLTKITVESLNGAVELIQRDPKGLYARLFLPQRRQGDVAPY